ncbi:MAG TPA: CAP domain-containing protein, partial [Pedobacter sp.]
MNQILKGAIAILTFASCTATQESTEKKAIPPPAIKKAAEKNSLVEVVDFQKEFLKQLNKLRAEGCKCGNSYMPPVPPLSWNVQLQLAALGHAQDMARNKYFSHVSKNGSKIKDRITASGYTHNGFQSF